MDHPPAVREIAEYDCRRAGVHLSSAEFERLMEFVAARTHETAPQQLWQLAQPGQTSPGLLAVLLPDVWRNKLDDCALPLQAWREMFTVVPYTADRALTPRPGRGRWLYRGATAEHRDGLVMDHQSRDRPLLRYPPPAPRSFGHRVGVLRAASTDARLPRGRG